MSDILEQLSDVYAEINKYASLDGKGAVSERWFAILSHIANAKGVIIDLKAEIERLRAGRAADPEAVEVARLLLRAIDDGIIVECSDQIKTVARALLASASSRAEVMEEMSPAVANAMEHFNAALLARRVLEDGTISGGAKILKAASTSSRAEVADQIADIRSILQEIYDKIAANDLVERIDRGISTCADNGWMHTRDLLKEAKTEIEHLRAGLNRALA